MGCCIYGGIYDLGNLLSDGNGFCKDVIEVLKELNSFVVCYLGGNFCVMYYWMDGIGFKENRLKRFEVCF